MHTQTGHDLLVYGLLLGIGLTGALGDLWIYKWAVSQKPGWLVAASVVWLASLILFGVMLRLDSRSFSAAFMLVSVFHAVVVVACDVVFFGGRLNRVEWFGMALALASVLVLELSKDEAGQEQHSQPGIETRSTQSSSEK